MRFLPPYPWLNSKKIKIKYSLICLLTLWNKICVGYIWVMIYRIQMSNRAYWLIHYNVIRGASTGIGYKIWDYIKYKWVRMEYWYVRTTYQNMWRYGICLSIPFLACSCMFRKIFIWWGGNEDTHNYVGYWFTHLSEWVTFPSEETDNQLIFFKTRSNCNTESRSFKSKIDWVNPRNVPDRVFLIEKNPQNSGHVRRLEMVAGI